MPNTTYDLGAFTQWGVVEHDLFIEKDSETEARQCWSWSPGNRKLARREVGPVELVDPHATPWPEVKAKMQAIREAKEQ